MSAIEQAIAEIAALKREVEKIGAKERPLTLRGWRDDFLGDSLYGQYTPVSVGAGSGGALVNNFHGGAYRLTAGAGAARSQVLWLGDAADGFATLDADLGWTMIARMSINATTNIRVDFGALDVASNNLILAGAETAIGGNWYLRTRTGGGAVNVVDTGITIDTAPHWHRLCAYPRPASGDRRTDYFLDGALIGTTTVSVPTIVLTARVRCLSLADAIRYNDLDYWGVIPMNL